MAIPNFFQQQQQSLQTGLNLGGAMQEAQRNALLNPMKADLLQSQIAGQQTQTQLGKEKTKQEKKENFIKGFRQDMGMLFAYNDDPEVYEKALGQIAPKYANDPIIGPFIDKLATEKDTTKRNSALLGMIGMLNPDQQKGEKPLQKSVSGMIFNPNTGKYSRDPLFFENQKDINKLELAHKKELKKIDVESEKAKERIKGLAEREKTDINDGLLAAQTMPILVRADKLLDLVNTGKPRQALLWGKKWLGIQAANEVELEQLMGKQILKQLKPTFGSQFTENEGRWLADMEANYGKSTEGNRALLRQGMSLVNQRALIGIEAAKFAGDERIQTNIQDWLDWTFSDDPQAEKKTTDLSDEDLLNKHLGGR